MLATEPIIQRGIPAAQSRSCETARKNEAEHLKQAHPLVRSLCSGGGRWSRIKPGESSRSRPDALPEQRQNHVHLISRRSHERIIVCMPLSCRLQNKLGKICFHCLG